MKTKLNQRGDASVVVMVVAFLTVVCVLAIVDKQGALRQLQVKHEKELSDLKAKYENTELYAIKYKAGTFKWKTVEDVVWHDEQFQGLVIFSKSQGRIEMRNSVLGVKFEVLGRTVANE